MRLAPLPATTAGRPGDAVPFRRPLTRAAALATVVLALAAAMLLTPARADAATSKEAELLAAVNAARTAAGVAPLRLSQAVSDGVSRPWSQTQANRGSIGHNPDFAGQISARATSQWTVVGENVGHGWSVASLQQAFMGSPAHRANVLDPRFTYVGLGVVERGAELWVTENFLASGAALAVDVPVPAGAPRGSLDAVSSPADDTVRVTGWAVDPETPAPLDVAVYVDGQGAGRYRADRARADVAAATGAGAAHGFDVTLPAGPGGHQVCVYALDAAPGTSNTTLGCRGVTVGSAAPVGTVDAVVGATGRVRVLGWTFDRDSSAPLAVHTYVDGRFVDATPAFFPRPDVAAAYGIGAAHGVDRTVGVPAGRHTVCSYAINVGAGTTNPLLGCRQVVVG